MIYTKIKDKRCFNAEFYGSIIFLLDVFNFSFLRWIQDNLIENLANNKKYFLGLQELRIQNDMASLSCNDRKNK